MPPYSHPRRPFAHLKRAAVDPPDVAPRLTPRQQQILDWIRGHLQATGMPPTRAEIAAGLGFSTASSAEDHLQALAKKGALELTPGTARGLRLKDIPGMPVQGSLPLVGRVAAGSPILAVDNVEAHYRIDPGCSPRAPTTSCACTANHGGRRHRRRRPSCRAQRRRRARPDRRGEARRRSDRQAPETARARNHRWWPENPDFAPIDVDPKASHSRSKASPSG